MGTTLGHIMEQRLNMIWGSSGVYHGATMEHTVEQQ